jgi:hypothetical protein
VRSSSERSPPIYQIPEVSSRAAVDTSGVGGESLATEDELHRLAATFGRDTSSVDEEGRGWTLQPASREVIPRLRELRSQADAWRDNEGDATAPGTPREIGASFGRRWVNRAPDTSLKALLDLEPRAPNCFDGELLRYAEGQGIDTWDDEQAKHEVRTGFWEGVREVAEKRR